VSRVWPLAMVGASGLLTFVSSFLPWWVLHVDTETYAGSAWQMSSRWAASVLLTGAAAATWSAARVVRSRVPVIVQLAALAAVVASIFLTLQQRNDVASWPPVEVAADPVAGDARESELRIEAYRYVELTDAEIAASTMRRDHLWHYTQPGLTAGPGYGYWTGLAGMALTGLSMLAGSRGSRHS
jgi:hypothetical protein